MSLNDDWTQELSETEVDEVFASQLVQDAARTQTVSRVLATHPKLTANRNN